MAGAADLAPVGGHAQESGVTCSMRIVAGGAFHVGNPVFAGRQEEVPLLAALLRVCFYPPDRASINDALQRPGEGNGLPSARSAPPIALVEHGRQRSPVGYAHRVIFASPRSFPRADQRGLGPVVAAHAKQGGRSGVVTCPIGDQAKALDIGEGVIRGGVADPLWRVRAGRRVIGHVAENTHFPIGSRYDQVMFRGYLAAYGCRGGQGDHGHQDTHRPEPIRPRTIREAW